MASPLLILSQMRLAVGRNDLLDGAELSVSAGDRLCLVGRNGSGKSTLLKIAVGMVEPDSGQRFVQPGTSICYLAQEPDLSGYADTLSYVLAGLANGDANRAYYLLGSLGLSGHEDPATLSGGEARRAALARALAPSPDILLLDEPTNHLDLPAIAWLEEELRSMSGAMVLISHDRRFLQSLSRGCIWLDRGRTQRLEQGFADFESWRDQLLEEEDVQRHKMNRLLAQETAWLRQGVKARRKRNQGRLARLMSLRQNERERKNAVGLAKMEAAQADSASSRVIEARDIAKSYDGRAIVRDFSIRIMKGDRIGIVGPNGAGKTTLLNMLIGKLAPDTGSVFCAETIVMASLDQGRALLDGETTLADVLTGGHGDTVRVGDRMIHVVSYMKDFLFVPKQARTPVRILSGGERARLLLARALAIPSNLLVLDEPTNDLDLETLDLLEEMLGDYAGTVIVVSHDRDFLDRVASSVLMAEEDGRFVEYAGGYSDMMAQRGAGVTARTRAEAPRTKTPTLSKAEQPRRKLTFSDQHALNTLPAQIEKLAIEIADLQSLLAQPDFYTRDAAAFSKASARLTHLASEREKSEARWLELEMQREELAGN